MYLGSCRYQLPHYGKMMHHTYIFRNLKEYEIDAFFYIGGNDSMDTVTKLSQYAKTIGNNIKIIGIPKTIDNDLCVYRPYAGLQFSTAKYVASTLLEIGHDTSIYPIKLLQL